MPLPESEFATPSDRLPMPVFQVPELKPPVLVSPEITPIRVVVAGVSETGVSRPSRFHCDVEEAGISAAGLVLRRRFRCRVEKAGVSAAQVCIARCCLFGAEVGVAEKYLIPAHSEERRERREKKREAERLSLAFALTASSANINVACM